MRTYGGISATERVAARRERLLDAGLQLFGTRGLDATGVKDVCRQAGLTDRYFYESFKDGRALYTAVFDRVTDELFAAVATAVAEVDPHPESQLRAAIGTFIRALAEDPRKPRIVFGEAAGVEDHMKATLRRFTALVEATAEQHLPRGFPTDILALSLVGTMERVVVEWQDGALDAPIDEVVEDVVDLFLGHFLRR